MVVTLDLSGQDDYAILVYALGAASAQADHGAAAEADVNQRQYFLDRAAAANTLLERVQTAVDRFYSRSGTEQQPR